MTILFKILCKFFGKHKFGPYEHAIAEYEPIEGLKKKMAAPVMVRHCRRCNLEDVGPMGGKWH